MKHKVKTKDKNKVSTQSKVPFKKVALNLKSLKNLTVKKNMDLRSINLTERGKERRGEMGCLRQRRGEVHVVLFMVVALGA